MVIEPKPDRLFCLYVFFFADFRQRSYHGEDLKTRRMIRTSIKRTHILII